MVPVAKPLDGRIFWLKATVGAGLAAGFLLSPKLWVSSRMYPLAPVWQFLPVIPPPFDYAWFGVLLALLVWIVATARPAKPIALFVALAATYALFDQSRWQPWFYQYLFMLAALGLYYANPGRDGQRDSMLNACRLIVVSIYFWSGIQKANPAFVHEAFPWMIEPFTRFLPEAARHWPDALGFIAPVVEVATAAGLVIAEFRRPAVISALAMHTFILACVGPLGHNYDSVVWPWNLAMGAMAILLFWPGEKVRLSAEPRDLVFRGLLLALFGIAPFLSFLNLWDGYLSFALYSGNNNSATIYMDDAVAGRLPDEIQEFVVENESKVDELEIFDWSFGELNVPPYAELRVFRNIGKRVCADAGNPSQMVLVVQEKSRWLQRRRQWVYDCAALSK
jgi:hypothetical protein